MPPEQIIAGSNLWSLPAGERIVGTNGHIDGPAVVRVAEYPDVNKMLVQSGGDKQIEVPGLDLRAATVKIT